MNRCILHVGMHKTGTTSIQESLKGFEDESFVYADLGSSNHSVPIYSLFASTPKPHHLHRAQGLDRQDIQGYVARVRGELDRSIEKAAGRSLVISGEDIRTLPPPDLASLQAFFGHRFDVVTVVAYIRPPAALLTSIFLEGVQGGKAAALKLANLTRLFPRTFSELDQIFGRENVLLWKYDTSRFPDGDVVQDFSERLGISLPKDRKVRGNVSLSRQAIALLYTYRKFGETLDWAPIRGLKARQLALSVVPAGDRFRFSPELMQSHLEGHARDIEWMEARLGESLREDLGEPLPGDIGAEEDLLRPDPATVDRLLRQLGSRAPERVRGETAEEVALLVHALRGERLSGREIQAASRRPWGEGAASPSVPGANPAPPQAVPGASKRRVIIHVGMHKTGTTSIQESLKGFADERFVYADLGSSNHSVPIYSLFSSNPERHHQHRAHGLDGEGVAQYIAKVREDLDRSIENAVGRTLIISGEDIRMLPPADLAAAGDFFGSRFDEVSVVAYVRPRAGLLTSDFQERVKASVVSLSDLTNLYPPYHRSFVKLDDTFGRSNVFLWKYDPASFPEGDVVQDFCARLGISLPRSRIVRRNTSIPRQAVALLYTYRKVAQVYGWKPLRSGEALQLAHRVVKQGDRFRFAPDLMRSVLEPKRRDIEWMEARLGEPLVEELGESQPGDVATESDLLRPDPATVESLLNLLGSRAPAGIRGETPEQLALLFHALRGEPLTESDIQSAMSGTAFMPGVSLASEAKPAAVTDPVKENTMGEPQEGGKCVIHVGMPGTGSSSIRQSLRATPDSRFLFYTDSAGRHDHSATLLGILGGPGGQSGTAGGEQSGQEARKHLEQVIQSLAGRTLILLCEGLLRQPLPKLRELAALLHKSGIASIEITAYVPPPVASVSTSFQRRVARGQARFDVAEDYAPYRPRLSRLAEAFGAENLKLWPFETSQHANVVSDFCRRLGMAEPSGSSAPDDGGLSRDAVGMLFSYHRFARELGFQPLTPPEARQLVARMRRIGGPAFRLSPELLRSTLAEQEKDIEWVKQHLSAPFAKDADEPRAGDVRSEDDLLKIDPAQVKRLRLLAGTHSLPTSGQGQQDVAALVEAVARQSAGEVRDRDRRDRAAPKGGVTAIARKLSRRTGLPQRPAKKGAGKGRFVPYHPLNERSLLDPNHNVGVVWSAKCACTKVLFWYFDLVGMLDQAVAFHHFPHRYRTRVLYRSDQYIEWLKSSDWRNYTWYQFGRDPVKRLLSAYRHNVGHGYADGRITSALGRDMSFLKGYSLDDFLTYVETQDLEGNCDVHLKLQKNPVSSEVQLKFINIDETDMLEHMARIRESLGMPAHDPKLDRLFDKDQRRTGKFVPREGYDSSVVLNRTDAKKSWPVSSSIIDEATKRRIERIYAKDLEFIYGTSTDAASPAVEPAGKGALAS